PLNTRIKHFYDTSTPIWLDTWGEHMHHGYYGQDGKEKKDDRQAQLDLIEELLRWGGVSSARRILDAGCGVGGSSRYLAAKFDAEAYGLTLSPVQAAKAADYTRAAHLEERVTIEARDMMTLDPEKDGKFDLIWSLESAEHIANKPGLFQLFHDLLLPGGKLLMITWCHRTMPPELTAKEQKLLNRVQKLYHLPPMIGLAELREQAAVAGLAGLRTADWSDAVAPFWPAVIGTALTWNGITGLVRSGAGTVKGAWAMRYMRRGYRQGLIRFGVLQATRP
ncbi:MAG: class I SAM-dependent methyltransferase, partial [Saprospiraceae bacterium]